MNQPEPIRDAMDDLDWLAFCYIADELNPVERESFEVRLSIDQLAREAVAEAVEQSQALYAGFDAPSLNNDPSKIQTAHRQIASPKRLSRPAWSTAIAVLSMIMIGGWMWCSRFMEPVQTVHLDREKSPATDRSMKDNSNEAPKYSDDHSADLENQASEGLDSADQSQQLASAWATAFSGTEIEYLIDLPNDADINQETGNDGMDLNESDRIYTNVNFESPAWLYDAVLEEATQATQTDSSDEPDPASAPKNPGVGI